MLDSLLARLAEATLSPNVIATLIGASAALLAAFIQLRISWRRDQARPRKPQESGKPRRAPMLWMIVLAVAAAVGGFTAAMFLIGRGLGDADEIRAELRQRVAQLSATAERFEKAAPASTVPVASAAVAAAPATMESLAAITVAPCRLRVVEPPAAPAQPCSENDALRVALCAAVPASADALKTATFVRSEDSAAAWADSRVPMGQDVGFARFADQTYERNDGGERRVCVGFWSWHPDRAQTARLAVEFAPSRSN